MNPDAAEVCNGIDDDCDTLVDDADDGVDTSTGSTFFADGDGDGYGDAGTPVQASWCRPGTSRMVDDEDDAVNPAATEVCDEIDNDCDGATDDDDPGLVLDGRTWYEDADGDGRGSTSTDLACVQPSGTSMTTPTVMMPTPRMPWTSTGTEPRSVTPTSTGRPPQ